MRINYVIGHWALTILLAPFMSQILNYFYGKDPNQIVSLLEVYLITLLFSVAFSVPTFFIYFASFIFLSRQNVNFVIAKFILIAISVSGIYTTQIIIQGSMTQDIIIAYSSTTVIVGIILRLKERKPKILDNSISN